MIKAARYLPIFAALSLTSCMTSQSVSDVGPNSVAMMEFRQGTTNLKCEDMCAGSFGAHRREMKQLYANGQWAALAQDVITIGFNQDLAYFYLGAAAEGLRYRGAALTYYNRASQIGRRDDSGAPCDGLINNCDGFEFPRDSETAMLRVAASRDPAAN
jgi:hypothetical protein